jgi:peptide/nickel transport system ATP-binding protein
MTNAVFKSDMLCRTYGFGIHKTYAVKATNILIEEGKIYSIVGESGSGKTTIAKMLLGLLRPTSGKLLFFDSVISLKTHKERVKYWNHVQAIFQDPFSSFNQFYKVQDLLLNCVKMKYKKMSSEDSYQLMTEACGYVNLDLKELWDKHAFELSGGQMQRLMIARIFIIKPKVLVADEPTSMIDACSRSMILDMLLKLKEDIGMTIIFITHDIGLAYYVSDYLYIMERGEVVEEGDARQIIAEPQARYTKQLLADVPAIHRPWLVD